MYYLILIFIEKIKQKKAPTKINPKPPTHKCLFTSSLKTVGMIAVK